MKDNEARKDIANLKFELRELSKRLYENETKYKRILKHLKIKECIIPEEIILIPED